MVDCSRSKLFLLRSLEQLTANARKLGREQSPGVVKGLGFKSGPSTRAASPVVRFALNESSGQIATVNLVN